MGSSRPALHVQKISPGLQFFMSPSAIIIEPFNVFEVHPDSHAEKSRVQSDLRGSLRVGLLPAAALFVGFDSREQNLIHVGHQFIHDRA